MRPATAVVIALLAAIAGSALTIGVLGPEREAAPAGEYIELEGRIEAVTAEVERLARELERRSTESAEHSAPPGHGWSEDEIRAIVTAHLEGRARADEPAPADPTFDAIAFVDDLRAGNLDEAERAALWEGLRGTSHLDAVLAELERRAEAAPRDSMAHTELAWGRFAKMLSVEPGPERGRWGQLGADALIAALEVDERNWDARFTLARHFFYAEMKGDAVTHFETLIEQQATRAPEDRHADAYLWLGNIHSDRGDAEAAARVWAEGARLFPRNEALRQRVEGGG